MMCDVEFDLSLALESDPDMTEVDCPLPAKNHGLRDDSFLPRRRCLLSPGLELEVESHPLHSFRHAATLIVALERMKKVQEKPLGTEFTGDTLFHFVIEQLVEEVCFDQQYQFNPTFTRRTQDLAHSIADQHNKSWKLNELPNGAAELLAITVQGPSSSKKVWLNLSTYVSLPPVSSQSQPVALGIGGRNLYLSCSESEGKPILQIEEIPNKEDLRSIRSGSTAARFLFYKTDSGVSSSTFESVNCPGWYISSAIEEPCPVAMCHQHPNDRITSFMVKQQ
ncbi:interleukin-1 beta-like [Lepisosteus oculatus]|uniref:interleukin-1 beta-like n=1 Tax=Lepisosteus oculatus TaxID=7918 RepID=UPI0035F52C72